MAADLSQLKIKNREVPFIFEEDKNLPIVSMQLIFKNSGSLSDTEDGLTKISAALLNEGTKKEGAVGFATKLENRAITLSTHAGSETFVIEVGALKEEFPEAIERLKELLSDPNYSEETLGKIKTQTIAGLKRKESDFDYISNLELKKMLFPNTPLAKPSSGTVKSVEAIKLADIQKNVKEHLGLGNAIVVMGGDISQKEATTFATTALSLLSDATSKEIATMKPVGKKQVKEKMVKSKQAYVYFGAPLNVKYDSKERHTHSLAN